MQKIMAESVGQSAFSLLRGANDLDILGQTSKGIFLRPPAARILFLSREGFRGPFTITLPWEAVLPEGPFSTCRSEARCIVLDEEILINTSRAVLFAPSPFFCTGEFQADLETAHRVGRLALSGQGQVDYPIRWLMKIKLDDPLNTEIQDERWGRVLRQGTPGSTILEDALHGILGYGRGLTPSGDDFILGMALGMARYPLLVEQRAGIQEIVHRVIESAAGRTTLISANLLEAASRNQADERLLQAFDGFINGQFSARQIYSVLKTWGNSSGLDAFCGLVFLLVSSPGYE